MTYKMQDHEPNKVNRIWKENKRIFHTVYKEYVLNSHRKCEGLPQKGLNNNNSRL